MYIASISLVVCLSLAVIAWIREREDSGYWQYLIRSGVWSLLLALDAGLMWMVGIFLGKFVFWERKNGLCTRIYHLLFEIVATCDIKYCLVRDHMHTDVCLLYQNKKGNGSCITFRFVGIYAAVCNRSTSQCHTSCNCKKRTLYGIQNHSNSLHRFDVDCNWCDRLYRI